MGKQLTSKQIYELREMLRITKTRKSRFDENATLENVVEDKVQHIIDNEIYKPPYISCFTVQQLLWGGYHWKKAEYKIKTGVLEHAGIQRPPNWYFADQGKRFGYIMDWPPLALRNVITQTMRNSFINPLLDGDIETPYRIGWCKGYIEEINGEAKYIPEQGKFISCYFIMRNETNLLSDIHNFILSQNWWFRKQWKMTLEKLPGMILSAKRMADRVHSRASVLSTQWQIDEHQNKCLLEDDLNPQIPKNMIDWRDVGDDEDDF